MEAVFDFHAFKSNENEYIVKELAIVGFACGSISYKTQIVFKAPYSFDLLNSKMQRTARWLSRHYHYIKWNDGHVVYSVQLMHCLCKPFSVIHVKGNEKARFLRQFHSNVVEIDQQLHVDTEVEVDCILSQHKSNDKKCSLKSATFYAQKLF